MKSVERIQDRATTVLNMEAIRERVGRERSILSESLVESEWKNVFKGRDVLREFAGRYAKGMRYEYSRDLIISLMASASHQPDGMKNVLHGILND